MPGSPKGLLGDGFFGARQSWMESFNVSAISSSMNVGPPQIQPLLSLLTNHSLPAYAPVLLERKLSRIIKSQDAEKGIHRQMRTPFQSEDRHWKRIFANALTRPFAMFAREPIIQLLGLYMAFVYGLLYCRFHFPCSRQQC